MKQKMVHVSFYSFFVSSQEQRQRSESLSTDLEAARSELGHRPLTPPLLPVLRCHARVGVAFAQSTRSTAWTCPRRSHA